MVMKEKVFPVSMAFLWGIVFTQSMQSIVLGICMGLLMGITFGLFDSGKGEKEDEEGNVEKQEEVDEK